MTDGPKKTSFELEMVRQYSETAQRVSETLERQKAGKDGEKDDDLKKEIEMWEHKVTCEELAEKLGTSLEKGLTSEDHKQRLLKDGPNMLTPPKTTAWYVKLLQQFLNFFALLLQVASILCFIAYGLNPADTENLVLGIVLYTVVIITAVFSFLQEFKSEKTMEKFKNFLPPQTVVHRDGKIFSCEAADLVVGDVIDVKLGDKIPADIRLIVNNKLKVDNSSLTGESEPLARSTECTDENPLETRNIAFFGTNAVEGTATGIVVNTGDRTLFGRIAGLAASSKTEQTTMQIEIHHFVLIISAFAIFLGVLFFIINAVKGTDWIENIVFCIGIIVANVPEGLLATVTVALTLTSKRMAKKNVLVKKLESVETLGSTTTICSDKTGTLTQNRMTIVHLVYDHTLFTAPTATQESSYNEEDPGFKTLFFGAVNCAKAIFDEADLEENPDLPIDERKVNGDASEAGILKFSEKITPVVASRALNPVIGGIPFNSTNKFMITIHKDSESPGDYRLLMKGAPERILERCDKIYLQGEEKPMSEDDSTQTTNLLQKMMNGGERVLGFAQLTLTQKEYPEMFEEGFVFDGDELNFPLDGLTFVGLMALLDPPRESVPGAVETCQTAGIQVIMVTGDHPATAKAIAQQVNIISDRTAEDVAEERGIPLEEVDRSEVNAIVIPGSQIKDFDEPDWDRALANNQIVFARTSPQQKLIIVENCQRLGKIVAVTGDGVNDSPALKKAHIGIAMGIAGSDVSKEAADMILLDDNFSSIVKGVEEGRLIFDNLKKSIAYTLTSNIPEITPFLMHVILGIPQPLTTILILLIDLGTDMLPAISFAYEKAESDIMLRYPRDMKLDRLVNRRLISFSYAQIGVIQASCGFFVYCVVLNDYAVAPRVLPGLSQRNQWGSKFEDLQRWWYTRRFSATAQVMSGQYFDDGEFAGDGVFDFVYNSPPADGFILQTTTQFDQIPRTATDSPPDGLEGISGIPGSDQFNNMIKAIGQVLFQPPCLAFVCLDENNNQIFNDYDTCFFQGNFTNSSGETVTPMVYYYGVNTGEANPNVIEITDIDDQPAGTGCFDSWTIEQQSDTLQHAQGAFFVSIVISQIGGGLICKTRKLSLFQQGMKNYVLDVGIFSEICLAVLLTYIPPINDAFGTASLYGLHWLPGIPFAMFEVVYDEHRKFWIRRGDPPANSRLGGWVRDFTYW
ncbi:hypothetical protein NDN08_007887 [Rhodosorus marinus]|uniref:Cation-transporting P-type ATPase N-terminal domain-containing protein n=1 Tax=Rhodosorus marinus TaxID=101924 RepID=A0AAV8V1M1_9RHOD|nr:hypothetical protein NDN08_007887 [Rhodosorus marinus]